MRGRGLKLREQSHVRRTAQVAPMRGRGLKHRLVAAELERLSRSHAGAWIETALEMHMGPLRRRRSHAGAWIETLVAGQISIGATVAPMRGRGLKQEDRGPHSQRSGSLPCGGVD